VTLLGAELASGCVVPDACNATVVVVAPVVFVDLWVLEPHAAARGVRAKSMTSAVDLRRLVISMLGSLNGRLDPVEASLVGLS
jgi:hypothetical protein